MNEQSDYFLTHRVEKVKRERKQKKVQAPQSDDKTGERRKASRE